MKYLISVLALFAISTGFVDANHAVGVAVSRSRVTVVSRPNLTVVRSVSIQRNSGFVAPVAVSRVNVTHVGVGNFGYARPVNVAVRLGSYAQPVGLVSASYGSCQAPVAPVAPPVDPGPVAPVQAVRAEQLPQPQVQMTYAAPAPTCPTSVGLVAAPYYGGTVGLARVSPSYSYGSVGLVSLHSHTVLVRPSSVFVRIH